MCSMHSELLTAPSSLALTPGCLSLLGDSIPAELLSGPPRPVPAHSAIMSPGTNLVVLRCLFRLQCYFCQTLPRLHKERLGTQQLEPKSVGCRLKWPLGHKFTSLGTLSFHSAVCGVSRLVLWGLQGDMSEVMLSELHLVFVLRAAWNSV